VIDLYSWPTAVDIGKGEQFQPSFLAISPNNRIPARVEVLQWLFWQVAGLGPMAGQNGHFKVYAPEKLPYAFERYEKETNRLYGVLNRRLARREFIAGSYSIAGMACYPCIVPHAAHGQDLNQFPDLKRCFDRIAARPATRAVYQDVAVPYARSNALSEEERRVLFGQTAANTRPAGDGAA